MYELRKGTMMLLTSNKSDVEMYKKAGWCLVTKKKQKTKTKQETIKEEINQIVEEVLEEDNVGK